LRKDKEIDQVCYYQAGIGTYFHPGVVRPLYLWIAKILDEAIAWYLYQHVMEGYRFIMQNYNVGDKLCLFGFSRGAYTARALAGMLHKVGLLSIDNDAQIPFAYKLYQESGNDALAQGFKATFCHEVDIDFVGVWDTVASVGLVAGRTLPFVEANNIIRVFRQALALDEHRVRFRPNLHHHSVTGSPIPKDKTDSKDVWFVGCHSDVGGGSVTDTEADNLANISLRWMIEQVVATDCPILFNLSAFARWKIPVAIAQKGHTASPKQDAQDVVQPIHDQLILHPIWWILELLPLKYTYQDAQFKWITGRSINFGRGRLIPSKPLFHKSVQIRMNDPKLKYKPKAQYAKGAESYVS